MSREPRIGQSQRKPADDLAESLGELGLTPTQSRAYIALLQESDSSATEVALRAAVPRPKIYDVLQSLEGHGLCTPGGNRVARWLPVAPEIALPELARRREQERRKQAGRDGEIVRELVRALPRPGEPLTFSDRPLIDALIGRSRVAVAFETLVAAAQQHLDIVQVEPMVQSAERWNRLECDALRRGVEVRVLYSPEVAADPSRYSGLLRAGGQGRISDKLVLKLAIRDAEEALVALRDPSLSEAGEDGFTSMRIFQADLVSPLQALFRREWRRAMPLRQPDEAA